MADCSVVITYTMKMTKILASGEEPTADELSDGMVALQGFYDELIGNGTFGRLNDVYVTDDYEAAEFERVIAPSGVTVTFPATLDDLILGGDRVPRDLSIIETIVNGTRIVKIWDQTAWVALLGLVDSDTAPLSGRGVWGLAAAFAASGAFAGMFGAEVGPDVQFNAKRFLGALSSKMTTQDSVPAVYY